MKDFIGIIGGSGVYDVSQVIKEHIVTTPWGDPSDPITEAEVDGTRFFFLPRHGKTHRLKPSEINYRANIFALKSLGVRFLISVSACGSLREEFPPTHFVLPHQFMDWTKGLRARSFFGDGVVGHVPTDSTINLELTGLISELCEKLDIPHHNGGNYLCIEGPQFSSKAESLYYKTIGADIIGMTNLPEGYLAKEAGMAYATIGMVTDYDCWKAHMYSLEEVLKFMKANNLKAQKLILEVIKKLGKNPVEYTCENKYSVLTPRENWTDKQKKYLEVLLR
ncbi:MAG: S-methyl-5'-thioadenosine phosphorylase [Deltaproteobacteria bacterium]|nr:MAG: S-methyl-5'-thioadenosine phosphorylase [Deltaproteobacteria bacterium]